MQSQWEILMRKFSKDCKRNDHESHIKTTDIETMTCEHRPLKQFSTGSTYEGTWDALGLCGYGTYTFPNGVVYKGEFENNDFHGDGELRYPDGTVLKGKWSNGVMVDRTIVFADGVHYKEKDWDYCKPPDRRYAREYMNGIQGGGKSYMTNDSTAKEPPEGMYDVGDGFYDPSTGTVSDRNDKLRIIRVANEEQRQWIEENCRMCSKDVTCGPQPNLYKPWLEVTLKLPSPPQPKFISENECDSVYKEFDINNSFNRPYAERSNHGKFKYDPHNKSHHADTIHLEPKEGGSTAASLTGLQQSRQVKHSKPKGDDSYTSQI